MRDTMKDNTMDEPIRPNGSRLITLASPHRQSPLPDMQSMTQWRRDILALVQERGKASTDELAKLFATSAVTIRTDLKILSEAGALVRTHGGAIARRENDDVPIDIKEGLRHAQKARIAAVAAAMIRDGETLILDSGSTTNAITRLIAPSILYKYTSKKPSTLFQPNNRTVT